MKSPYRAIRDLVALVLGVACSGLFLYGFALIG